MTEKFQSDLLQKVTGYYSLPSPMSDPKQYAPLFAELPSSVPELVKTLQGLMVHIFWAGRYGLELPKEREEEVQIRPVWRKMERLLELDPRPLVDARPLEQRLVGNCRDFSLMGSAMLRARGYPARARCGFGTYFIPDHFEDHWMIEYWSVADQRWVQVDAQLDEFQQEKLGIRFDVLDMPAGEFVTAGQAWLMCRRGEADPDKFGIFEYHGWDFIKENLIRDLLALNKFETLPWDFWGIMQADVADFTPEQTAFFDRMAELTLGGNEVFEEVQAFYQQNECLHAPEEWAD